MTHIPTSLEDHAKSRTNILLVDDNPDNLLAMQVILQDPDYHLLQATSGHQALSLLEENEVGLIILDVRMPVLDGFDTATLIRARHTNPQLPIIFLSRSTLEANHLNRALSLGTVDYITKPVESVVLQAKVRQMVDLFVKGKDMRARLDILYGEDKVDILVVGSGPSALLALQSTLQKFVGARVQTAHSCDEAFRLLLQSEYCLLVIDVDMPALNGFALASLIRQHQELKGIPIIFASTSIRTNEDMLRGYAAGASDFISVSCPAEILLAKAGAIINMAGRSRLLTRELQKIEQLNRSLQETNRLLEEKHQEAEIAQKQLLHTEKLSAIGKLSASIVHELNSPLQGILFFLNGLKKQAILEVEDMELLDTVIDESYRIKDLIRNLRDFNRPSPGRKQLMDVHKSLDALLLLFRSDFNRRKISVERNYATGLPQIMAVADQIKQVFLNLLTNATEACRQHDGVITISTWQEGDKVAVAIKDTGIGIKPADMKQIFQPFFTTRSDFKGTGLGLSITHGIIKNHQGEITVDSQPGEGATFTVLLPVKIGDPAPFLPAGSCK
jgi:signal transduction histidine kinase/AmiR/NasT family two-component response regulator